MKLRTEKFREHAPVVLRIAISLVVLWFGFTNIFNPDYLVGYLPGFASSVTQPLTIMILTGIFEVVFGLLLLIGLFTRISALLLSIHILIIMFGLGYNDVAIRDFGLALACFAIFLHGPDKFCLETKLRKRKY